MFQYVEKVKETIAKLGKAELVIKKLNIKLSTLKKYVCQYKLEIPPNFYIDKRKGRKLSEAAKKRISESKIGTKNSFYNRKHTDETKRKMKDNHADFNGTQNPFKKSLENPQKLIEHKLRCKEIWAKRDDKQREEILGYRITYIYKEISSYYWNTIIRGAESRKLEFNITPEYIWDLFLKQDRKCALSGLPIELKKFKQKATASLDRIDSKKGYIAGNVQWVHKRVNALKMAFKEDEFLTLCITIAKHQNELSK